MFDAFRRGERVWFELDDRKHFTTVGQLNFWSIIIKCEIIDLLMDREEEVRDHAS